MKLEDYTKYKYTGDVGNGYALGMPLLEVFSVTINKNEDSDRCYEVYGTIRVIDGRGTDATLYDRGPENSECISPNETLTLTGPHRCISALTGFTMYVDLKDKNGGDLEISKGKIHWDRKKNHVLLDNRLTINIPGKNGFATVHCAVYSVASQADVKISLFKKDEITSFAPKRKKDGRIPLDGGLNVYGTIVAHYGEMSDYSTTDQRKYFRSTLFDKPLGKAVKLEDGKFIPLSRSVVTVPTSKVLIIEASLFLSHSNVQSIIEEGDCLQSIVKGETPEYIPVCGARKDIEGEECFLTHVAVGWDHLYKNEDFK